MDPLQRLIQKCDPSSKLLNSTIHGLILMIKASVAVIGLYNIAIITMEEATDLQHFTAQSYKKVHIWRSLVDQILVLLRHR